MSVVSDQVRRLNAYFDGLLPDVSSSEDKSDRSESHEDPSSDAAPPFNDTAAEDPFATPRLVHLRRLVQSLNTKSPSQPLLSPQQVRTLLLQSGIPQSDIQGPADDADHAAPAPSKGAYEGYVEWLLVTKATVQVYGIILNVLMDRIMLLSDDIWYWNQVLSSYPYSSFYTVQTSPLRVWARIQDVYLDVQTRLRHEAILSCFRETTSTGLSQRWRRFYGMVRQSIRERSLVSIQHRIQSPVALCRSEARENRAQLRKMREVTASGLGMIMDEGLPLGRDGDKNQSHDHREMKNIVERSVALMDLVLAEVCTLDVSIDHFEEKVFAAVASDPECSADSSDGATLDRPAVLARRLVRIIDTALPEHCRAMEALAQPHGRPSRFVRYWLPVATSLVSSASLLRLVVKRKADIVEWIADFGATVRGFWLNWIVEPTQKVIKTIRHDETSEIAIMSRDSLRADRESLERMVVDFATDKPHFAGHDAPLSHAQMAGIRAQVTRGDVTPVLRAYEKDIKRPLTGAVRGDLVRSLLIQVQKTKVDLEVAMTGIDSLLKSQELVFGFVGLTPGVLVLVGLVQYLRGALGGRTGQRRGAKAVRATRLLRNIDRIMSQARPREIQVLPYKDHGLLICELQKLRQLGGSLMPRDIEKDFLEDLDDLANIKDIPIQTKTLDRIRWAYARWLS